MRNGYRIGAEKLSEKQFSDKYWMAGDAEYQFHSMDIQDGLDERQQLLINNDRALYQLINEVSTRYFQAEPFEQRKLREAEKAIGFLKHLQLLWIWLAISRLFFFFFKRITQNNDILKEVYSWIKKRM